MHDPFVVELGPEPLAVERRQLVAEPVHAAPSVAAPVVADTANGADAVFLAERLTTVQLDDAHSAAQLVEPLKRTGQDAEQPERDATIGRAAVGR
jgi:hypothetical protein